MDNNHQGRYFFIDTNPSSEPQSNQDSKSYDSDSIDEEIEHRLYSLVHHSSDANSSCTTPLVDATKLSLKSTKPVKKHNTDDLEVSASKRRKTSPKVLKKDDFMAPSTSSSSTANNIQGDNFNSTIYLSDSDEDNESEDVNSADGNKNLWHIDYRDILIANPVHGKFYRPKIWCSRCRKEGNHPVKLCHLPKYKICYICGEIGHLGQHCKNQHCKRCMDFHPTSKCSLNVRDFQCRICHKHGHLDDNCPNHWRKYHQITDETIDPDLEDAVVNKNTKICCGVCGKQRHYAYECDRLRQRNIEVSSPFDFNTTFGGNFHPNRSKSHRKSNQTFKQSTEIQAATGRRNYRRPRYFAPKNQDVASDPGSMPQITIKNNRKKSKSEKRNKKKKSGRKSDDSVQIISGPAIHSGRVEKSKTRQQQKRRNRKAAKNSKTQYFDTINLANSNIMIGFRR